MSLDDIYDASIAVDAASDSEYEMSGAEDESMELDDGDRWVEQPYTGSDSEDEDTPIHLMCYVGAYARGTFFPIDPNEYGMHAFDLYKSKYCAPTVYAVRVHAARALGLHLANTPDVLERKRTGAPFAPPDSEDTHRGKWYSRPANSWDINQAADAVIRTGLDPSIFGQHFRVYFGPGPEDFVGGPHGNDDAEVDFDRLYWSSTTEKFTDAVAFYSDNGMKKLAKHARDHQTDRDNTHPCFFIVTPEDEALPSQLPPGLCIKNGEDFADGSITLSPVSVWTTEIDLHRQIIGHAKRGLKYSRFVYKGFRRLPMYNMPVVLGKSNALDAQTVIKMNFY